MPSEAARQRFLDDMARHLQDPLVLGALERVPRERFVASGYGDMAYADNPLPIGCGQTISQPLMVALMTEALQLRATDRVLEIGTGSGYQTAILAELAAEITTVERFPGLQERAGQILHDLGYQNVHCHVARDDVLGWPDNAPYDAIIVTAGAPEVPEALLQQLAPQGRIVIPAGSREQQELLRITKGPSGLQTEHLGGCRFVPLVGPSAWSPEAE